jgi:hypothetical protein
MARALVRWLETHRSNTFLREELNELLESPCPGHLRAGARRVLQFVSQREGEDADGLRYAADLRALPARPRGSDVSMFVRVRKRRRPFRT